MIVIGGCNMFKLFNKKEPQKTKVNAYSLGKMLAEQDTAHKHSKVPDYFEGISQETYEKEFNYLHVFTNDLLFYLYFGEFLEIKRGILDGYYSVVTQQYNRVELYSRVDVYVDAYKSKPPTEELDNFWNVGKKFCEFCNIGFNVLAIGQVILISRSQLITRTELMNKLEITL
jgi:hypothetical protein